MKMSLKPKYTFLSKKTSCVPDSLDGVGVVFVGPAVDDRSRASVSILNERCANCRTFKFDVATQSIYLDEKLVRRTDIVDLLGNQTRVLLDTTTLGVAEILQLLMAVSKAGLKKIEFLYAEPGEYTQKEFGTSERANFDLTKNCQFRGVQGYAHEFDHSQKASHIFFLGFEASRLKNAIEQRGEIDTKKYKCHLVIGVPAFQVGWELNSIRPHLFLMEELGISEQSITYCAANSIHETYLTLWNLYTNLGDERECFFVSPLGTKPHSVGAALFLFETKGYENATSLYYDHPERVSKRSKEVGAWHHVEVDLGD